MMPPPERNHQHMNGLAGLRWLVAYLHECNIPAESACYRSGDDTYSVQIARPLAQASDMLANIGLQLLDVECGAGSVWLTVDLPRYADLSDFINSDDSPSSESGKGPGDGVSQ